MASATFADSDQDQTIATLRVGEELDGVFACTRKERQISRAGTPYLTIELRDRTGSILARVFRDADVLAGRFERGDLVRVGGRVARFRDELQAEVHAIARATAPTPIRPASFRSRTVTSTSSKASWNISRARSTTPG
jgi:3'-5' exoribonuclease